MRRTGLRRRRGVELALSGELDSRSVGQLQAELARAIDGRRVRLVVDLSAVVRLDAAAASVLRSVARRVRACGGTFDVVGVSPAVEGMVRHAGITWQDPREAASSAA